MVHVQKLTFKAILPYINLVIRSGQFISKTGHCFGSCRRHTIVICYHTQNTAY